MIRFGEKYRIKFALYEEFSSLLMSFLKRRRDLKSFRNSSKHTFLLLPVFSETAYAQEGNKIRRLCIKEQYCF